MGGIQFARMGDVQQQQTWKRWIVPGTTIAIAVIGLAVIELRSDDYAPPPGVTGVEAAFLTATHERGLTNDGGDAATLRLGRAMCVKLGSGESVDGIAEHWDLVSTDISADGARFFVHTAAAAFCPEFL